MFSVLAHPAYRRLFAAQVLSLLGTGLTTVALGLLAYDLAGAQAGLVLGTALALKMVVYVSVAPVAELVARRLPRKAYLVTLDLLRAAFVLVLPFVTEVWQIYVLIVLFQSCSAGFTPVFQAIIPDLIDTEEAYTKALSLSRLAYDTEALLSPLLAGLLLSLISFHWLFVGTTLGFLASALLVAAAALPGLQAVSDPSGFRRKLLRGSWIYLATPRLRGLLALSFAVASAGAMVIVNTVVLVQDRFGGTEQQVAMLFASYGAGSMAVALGLPHLLHLVPERSAMLGGAAGLAIGMCCIPFLPGLAPAFGLWAFLGAAAALVQTPAGLLLRRSAHAEDRPAVFAAQFALSHACWLVSYPLAGWGGVALGLSAISFVLAACVVGAIVTAVRLWPESDPLVIEHEHEEVEHEHGPRAGPHHALGQLEGPATGRHRHRRIRHTHTFVIDDHHPVWPRS
ncbi:MFS transporter [Tropicimonas sp. S265A]|uniref:MFS transporter n=1 Tax=Tropicimonas sp. S265A TaxID=3415134 RepID=UPI003C7CAB78